jgi:hypothetical protein
MLASSSGAACFVLIKDFDLFDNAVLQAKDGTGLAPHALGEVARGAAGFRGNPDGIRAIAYQRDAIVAKSRADTAASAFGQVLAREARSGSAGTLAIR